MTATRASVVRQALAAPKFRAAVADKAPREVLAGLDAWLAEDAAACERAKQRLKRANRPSLAAQRIDTLRAAKAAGLGPEHYVEDFYGEADLPPYPTQALPGSEEKIQILTERATHRVQLHHPLDAGPRAPDVDLPPALTPKPVESAESRRRRLLSEPW
jgi:hypothetical protein